MSQNTTDPFDDLAFYAELGLQAGLEIHQQILTKGKMFCRCPAGKYCKDHDGVVLRHMRPTLSEMGTYDGTALMEFKTRKEIVYLLNDESVCTYEMDDTPPFPLDEETLDVSIVLCLALGCPVVDEVHIARKQYLDGSIPTGFQRTGIVGLAGKLPFKGRQVGIRQISVEEDSCREVSNKGHRITFRTDRLGMPLIEVVTDPDFKTPREISEGALLIGRILRSTGMVRTGLGATRQDVNVSVAGGTRCEIKGVQYYQMIPQYVHNEAIRQSNLLAIRRELHLRGVKSAADLVTEEQDVTGLFLHSQLAEPAAAVQAGDHVRAIVLKDLAGIVSMPTQPDYSFNDELKGRVRVVACLDEEPILYDSEHWPEACAGELNDLRSALDMGEKDSLVIVWGPVQDTVTATGEIRLRLEDAISGVPNETRKPLPDGHTGFERVLPGPDRMYPDTDHPVIALPRERIKMNAKLVPVMPWVRQAQWQEKGLSKDASRRIAISPYALPLEDAVEKTELDPRRGGFLVAYTLRSLRHQGLPAEELTRDEMADFLAAIAAVKLEREGDKTWLRQYVAAAPGEEREAVLTALRGQSAATAAEAAKVVGTVVDGSFVKKTRGNALDWYVGKAMAELRGRYPGKALVALVKEKIGEQN